MCKSCRNTRKEAVRREHKIKFIKILNKKREVKCERCGYNKSFAAIDFHHKRDKLLNISKAIGKLSSNSFTNGTTNEILREISKCEILCSAEALKLREQMFGRLSKYVDKHQHRQACK